LPAPQWMQPAQMIPPENHGARSICPGLRLSWRRRFAHHWPGRCVLYIRNQDACGSRCTGRWRSARKSSCSKPVTTKVLDGDFETYAALVYGKCEILPDHSDRCEIGTGPLFTKVGALVLAEDGSRSLVVAAKTGKSLRYFDLTSWKLRGEPGGQRAAFKTWSLWHDGLAQSAPSARLLGYSVE
jgi:hypothetical protein